jgi:hypothetical protein
MHNFARCIKSTSAFAFFYFEHTLKYLTEHFGVNGYFGFERFVFFYGKIVKVENIEYSGAFFIFIAFV